MKSKLIFFVAVMFVLSACKRERYNSSFVLLNRIVPKNVNGLIDYKFKVKYKAYSKESKSYLEVLEISKDSTDKQLVFTFDVCKPLKSQYLYTNVDYAQLNKDEITSLTNYLGTVRMEFAKLKVKKRYYTYTVKDDFKVTFFLDNNIQNLNDLDGSYISFSDFTLWKGDKSFRIHYDYFILKCIN